MFFKRKKELVESPKAPLDFEKDIQALMYLIKHEIRNVVSLVTISRIKDPILKEHYVRDTSSELSSKIYTSLSEEYREVLLRYFTEEAIVVFITETISVSLIQVGLDSNEKQIFSITQ